MLNENAQKIIKATLPILTGYSEKITERMYASLPQDLPELKNFFVSEQRKQVKLPTIISEVIHLSAHLSNTEVLVPALTKIAYNHRKVKIQPTHFKKFEQHFLTALKQTLGNAGNPDILGAWGQSMTFMTLLLTRLDTKVAEQLPAASGGGEFREFRVAKKQKVSEESTSFYLAPKDGGEISSFEPGQFIRLRAGLDDGIYIREYCLSDSPGNPFYRITVKCYKEEKKHSIGKVSQYLHKEIHVGDSLWVSEPQGDFVLPLDNKTRPIVLISGGSGQAPLLSMLNHIVRKTRTPATFIHSTFNGDTHALRDEVASISKNYASQVAVYFTYDQPTITDRQQKSFDYDGLLDTFTLKKMIFVTDAYFYISGPKNFVDLIQKSLKQMGVVDEDMHTLTFTKE